MKTPKIFCGNCLRKLEWFDNANTDFSDERLKKYEMDVRKYGTRNVYKYKCRICYWWFDIQKDYEKNEKMFSITFRSSSLPNEIEERRRRWIAMRQKKQFNFLNRDSTYIRKKDFVGSESIRTYNFSDEDAASMLDFDLLS